MWNPIIFIYLGATLLFPASTPAQVIVLNRATVIDGSGAPPQKDVTIVTENGRIRDIGPAPRISR